ncbi:MAG: hypothetical protein RMJ97_10000 [Raineya sp.]|nr:hypothetical protein [Raineya sp.]MDW8297197.1 hypothetical protein [Raineya sp.]
MKKTSIYFVVLFLAFAMLAEAQRMGMRRNPNRPPKTPEQRANALTNRLTKRLGLNGEQKEQIYKINLQAAQRIDELRTEARAKRERGEKPERGYYAQKIRELNQQRDQNIMATLNAQQKLEYEKIKQKRKETMKKRMEKRRKMRQKLNKSDTGYLENDNDFEEMLLDEVEEEL